MTYRKIPVGPDTHVSVEISGPWVTIKAIGGDGWSYQRWQQRDPSTKWIFNKIKAAVTFLAKRNATAERNLQAVDAVAEALKILPIETF